MQPCSSTAFRASIAHGSSCHGRAQPQQSRLALQFAKVCHNCCQAQASADRNQQWLLGQQFPNALLLHSQQLPSLHRSKHYISLTNGLALAPLLCQLELPFSFVRIRSTCLEQQSFEALMTELDANFLLPLALGHSCIVWDCGARNKNNGAPRAVWYGLEFIRFALHRFWLGGGGTAHLRGHDVSRDFEQACSSFKQSTKKRLRYYKRYVTPKVQKNGIRLAGMFRRTDRDGDAEFFVQQAWHLCGPSPVAVTAEDGCKPSASVSTGSMYAGHHQHVDEAADHVLSARDVQAYDAVIAAGCGMFTGGLSHQQFLDLAQHPCSAL